MLCTYFLGIFIILNILCDFNYLIRCFYTVISGKLYPNKLTLKDMTTMYGMCTFQDCDILCRNIRIARLLRELDFARYHFYERTGIYQRSKELSISSLQGCTLTKTIEPVPLFAIYKINTKLIYWDNRSLFLEHEVVTLHDGRIRSVLVSRQHAIRKSDDCTEELLKDLPGSEKRPVCPKYIEKWLHSMQILSNRLKRNT